MPPEAEASSSLPTVDVLGVPVTALPLHEQARVAAEWAERRASKVVCVANVHMTMEAQHQDFGRVLKESDLVMPDGMPLVWMMRRLGSPNQERLAGLDVLMALCEEAQARSIGVYLMGSTPEVLAAVSNKLQSEYPALMVKGAMSPPFRPMTDDEDAEMVDAINASGAGLVLVALGCPKQERWMHAHKGRVQAVMVGLGGAFPVYAGLHKRAPKWVRDAGWEWAYRLAQEPRRLWRRYWDTNLPFIAKALLQLNAARRHSR